MRAALSPTAPERHFCWALSVRSQACPGSKRRDTDPQVQEQGTGSQCRIGCGVGEIAVAIFVEHQLPHSPCPCHEFPSSLSPVSSVPRYCPVSSRVSASKGASGLPHSSLAFWPLLASWPLTRQCRQDSTIVSLRTLLDLSSLQNLHSVYLLMTSKSVCPAPTFPRGPSALTFLQGQGFHTPLYSAQPKLGSSPAFLPSPQRAAPAALALKPEALSLGPTANPTPGPLSCTPG